MHTKRGDAGDTGLLFGGARVSMACGRIEEVVGPPVKVTLLADRWEPPPGLF